ncbi:hypothetical protein ETAA8_24980 [Anatilimnocola aggregata]|uniref:Uncharacterized protein n=1 Tax=Anatilimnocola aggregata TaxID=2528021 RepID=A0A517YB34_9BACT|nr:LamG-like jellyroll fold domain-containing protein [Anatilimnocola aggregata]QDU27411.1 hypothetical protein ETAA8_24980 [Anatilimnocola aggregata]
MAEQFDPYYTWLGIPPEDQPADYYRLLGLKKLESNLDVISHAADRQMAHLRTLQTGKHATHSQRLLNEISSASTCLLTPEKKAAYDRKLREEQKAKEQTVAKPTLQVAKPLPVAKPNVLPVAASVPLSPQPIPVMPQPLPNLAPAPIQLAPSFRHNSPAAKSGLAKLILSAAAIAAVFLVALTIVALNLNQPPEVATRPASAEAAPTPPAIQQSSQSPIQKLPTPPVVPTPKVPQPDATNPAVKSNSPVGSPASTSPAITANNPPPAVPANVIPASAPPEQFVMRLPKRARIDLQNTQALVDFRQPFTYELAVKFDAGSTGFLFGNRNHLNLLKVPPTGPMIGYRWNLIGLPPVTCLMPPPTGSEWFHLAISHDDKRLYAFVNGRKVDEADGEFKKGEMPVHNVPLYFGSHPDHSPLFSGVLGGIRISSVARYVSDFAPPTKFTKDADTLLVLDMANPQPGVMTDLSGQGHDGSIKLGEWEPGKPDYSTAVALLGLPLPTGEAVVATTPNSPSNPTPFGESPAFGPQPAIEPTQLLAVPDEALLMKARVAVFDVFGAAAKQATKPELKVKVAQDMLKLASETKDDLAAEYVLLDNARKLLIGAGDVQLALAAVAQMEQRFMDPAREIRTTTLTALADANLSPEAREQLVNVTLAAMDAATQARQFSLTEQLSLLAVRVSTKLKDADARKAVAQRRTEVVRLRQQVTIFEAAQETLKSSPSDAAANLVIGKFLCFLLHDFAAGRTHLIAGDLPELAEAAKLDLAADQGTPADKVAAANAWLKWVEGAKGTDKDLTSAAQVRAKARYREALPSLTGLEKVKVEKWLADLAAVADVSSATPGTSQAVAKGPVLVIYNTHGFRFRDRGTLEFNVLLLKDGKIVDQARGVPLEWNPEINVSKQLQLGTKPFDTIRVEITRWQEHSGGLAEVELLVNSENVLRGKPVTASGKYGTSLTQHQPAMVTDGIKDEERHGGEGRGYWILPNKTAGWIEISLK